MVLTVTGYAGAAGH